MKKPFRQHGYMAIDMVFGLIIITAVASLLAAVNYRTRAVNAGLTRTRQAVHLAEHAMLNLQHHQPLPTTAQDIHLTIAPITTGTAPAGYVWAKVDASVQGHHQSLIGLIPARWTKTAGEK